MIEKVTGRQVPHHFGQARAGDPPSLYANPARAKEVLGWSAAFGLEEIVSTAWNWEKKLAPSSGNTIS